MNRRVFIGLLLGVIMFAKPATRARDPTQDVDTNETEQHSIFAPDEVRSLNAFQRSRVRHPYTCVNGRRSNHLDREGVLVATERGWLCPYCDYTQTSARAWMKNWEWKR